MQGINFDKAYANKVGKKQWIEDHKHFEIDNAYKGIDLGAEWEALQSKSVEEKPKAKAKAGIELEK